MRLPWQATDFTNHGVMQNGLQPCVRHMLNGWSA
jgi:hypothetical protein